MMKRTKKKELNIRDLGGIPLADGKGAIPKGLFWRSGKLSLLSQAACRTLCWQLHINCVIDLRTAVESAEYPDPLPEGIEYLQVPLITDAAVGITHETGSDPMTVIRRLRRHPEELKEMIPDFKALYRQMVTDEHSRGQVEKAVALLRERAAAGRPTLFHCTAGKDRTGIVAMALLKSYGVSDEEIIKDYLRTNRNTFWPTMKKCIAIGILTRNFQLVRTAYNAFMAHRELIETAIEYAPYSTFASS